MLHIGDKVRTPDGTVIRVEGIAYGQFHHAADCKKVSAKTPATASAAPVKAKGRAARARGTDAIVWGT